MVYVSTLVNGFLPTRGHGEAFALIFYPTAPEHAYQRLAAFGRYEFLDTHRCLKEHAKSQN